MEITTGVALRDGAVSENFPAKDRQSESGKRKEQQINEGGKGRSIEKKKT